MTDVPTRYIIERAQTSAELMQKVNQRIEQGYQPYGSLLLGTESLIQAMMFDGVTEDLP